MIDTKIIIKLRTQIITDLKSESNIINKNNKNKKPLKKLLRLG